MLLVAASLLFVHPAPLEMPRAEAYLVSETNGLRRLEDRYDVIDLWTSRTVLGRWEDEDGRCFTLANLSTTPPKFSETTVTRERYGTTEAPLGRKELVLVREAAQLLTAFPLMEEPESLRTLPRGFRAIDYWQGTNTTALVATFRCEDEDFWRYASWSLLPEDDPAAARRLFETELFENWSKTIKENLPAESRRLVEAAKNPPRTRPRRSKKSPGERELLRADARNSVANYVSWRVTDGDEFSVLDDLGTTENFVTTWTNDFKVMRARYAEVWPTPLVSSNVLAVARIYRDRDEYLDRVGDELKWSAAYWSSERRELVAYLPREGQHELVENLRHEAFHQYLAYAWAMIPSSPWLNEGYAQYFEDESSSDWKLGDIVCDIEAFAEVLPSIFALDYEAFYAGTDAERRVKYRLAWSLAYFFEKGAPKVRFEPFADFKRLYTETLLSTKDAAKATAVAFGSTDKVKLFVREWKKFWVDM